MTKVQKAKAMKVTKAWQLLLHTAVLDQSVCSLLYLGNRLAKPESRPGAGLLLNIFFPGGLHIEIALAVHLSSLAPKVGSSPKCSRGLMSELLAASQRLQGWELESWCRLTDTMLPEDAIGGIC